MEANELSRRRGKKRDSYKISPDRVATIYFLLASGAHNNFLIYYPYRLLVMGEVGGRRMKPELS